MSPKPQRKEVATVTEEHSPITLLRDLQSGDLDPGMLSVDARRACVEHLSTEGYSSAEIAEVLKISPRTVFRDMAEIRKANAVQVTPEQAREFVGDLVQQAHRTIARLRRVTRDRDCPASVKVDAERAAWGVSRELIETLQRLGFLPTAVQEIRADLRHTVDASPTLEELQAQADDLARALGESGDEQAKAGLVLVQDEIARHRTGEHLRALAAAAETQEVEDDGTN